MLPSTDQDPKEYLNNEDLDEELVLILKDLADKYDKEDSFVRNQQVKVWKKAEEFWHGVQFIFWSESRQDWTSPTNSTEFGEGEEEGREDSEGPFYDFVTNIYKAHGESIISALSAQTPAVRFPPDDAENDEDVITSKTYAKIADLIQRHNNAKILLLRALFYLWNQGVVFAYHCNRSDKAYGINKVPRFKKGMSCPNCEQSKPVEDEEGNEEDVVEGSPCPTCGSPMAQQVTIEGFDESPKTRIAVELWGGLHCKVSNNTQQQKDWPYMIFTTDQPVDLLKHLYPHVADKIDEDYESGAYERVARTPSNFSAFTRNEENRNLRPLRRIWLRNWTLAGVPKEKEKERKKLQKMFPNGIYVCFIGKTYVESRDEDLDKYWTGGQAGLSSYWHSDGFGQSLIPIQEMTNVLTNLTLETIEQGIPSGFADPDVLNFDVYSRHEARPGMMYPARPKRPEMSLNDSFYEGNRATLSKEVPFFGQKLTEMGQFVVGSFPSIYGGPGEGKSRTAAEYNMSRQMALQRLSIGWTFLTFFWAKMVEKCVHLYVETMVDDEKYTMKSGKEDWVSVWIRRSEVNGKVGDVEAEGAETFPISTPQKQSLFFKILELNNEMFNTAITDPSNRSTVADLLSFPDFNIPGEDQRIRQVREINLMIRGGQPVPTHPEFDDDEIHIATLRHFLIGQEGEDLEATNPQAFQAILMHLQMHSQQEAQTQMKQMMMQSAMQGNKPVGPPDKQEKPSG